MRPNETEHRLVARALLESGTLIGSHDEIWTHPMAFRALVTLRHCITAISELVRDGFSVNPAFIKARAMQLNGGVEVPFILDEMADFIVNDLESRVYWRGMCQDDMFPHKCPRCGAAAFVGFLQIECKAGCR